MTKIPKDPRDIFSEFTQDYKELCGDDLISIILYGSAVGQDYRPGKSDINFMIVLTENGIDHLDRMFDVVKKWRKRNVIPPLFLTEEYVKTSLDVFPIEYMAFKRSYVLVFGKDLLKDLTPKQEYIRLQCEREVKGKLLLLREAFLSTSGKGRALRDVICQSNRAVMSIFNALTYLKGEELFAGKRELIRSACEAFDLDKELFEKLLDIKEEKLKPAGDEMKKIFLKYLTEWRKLSNLVDTLGE